MKLNSSKGLGTWFGILFLITNSEIAMGTARDRNGSTLTAYEVVEEYAFPVGILPKGVKNYTLDTSNGSFEVYMGSSCSFDISSYKLTYKSTFTGTISTDLLSDLSGVTVKVWIFTLSLSKVVRSSSTLKFYVGSFSKSFPVSNFDESPECGCGFDCLSSMASKPLLQSSQVASALI